MATIFNDTFTDTANINLDTHTPEIGTGWVAGSGTMTISSNGTARVTVSPAHYNSDALPSGDGYVDATFLALTSGDQLAWVCVRFVDVDNWIGFGVDTINGSKISLYKMVAGVLTNLAETNVSNGTVYRLEFEGSTLRFYNDAVQVGGDITEAAHQTATGQALYAQDNVFTNWLDTYETGTLGAGATTSVTTGTSVPTQTEADIVTGGKTIILTLTNDTFAAAGTGPIGSTADTQAIIDGLDSAQSELTGWNAEVRDKEVTTAVVRTSDTVCTITLTSSPLYDITATETITATIPAAVLVTSATPVVSSPTFTVTHVVAVPSITTSPIKNNSTQIAISDTGIIVDVYDDSTGVLVVRKTGLTSSVAGIVTFADALLSAATVYKIVITRTNNAIGLERITSA